MKEVLVERQLIVYFWMLGVQYATKRQFVPEMAKIIASLSKKYVLFMKVVKFVLYRSSTCVKILK